MIAVAGKGGTGKTTLSGLLVRHMLQTRQGPVFAVDADANANFNEVLGVKVLQTVGAVREDVRQSVGAGNIPAGLSKDVIIETEVEESLIEAEGFDLLVMGRPEGPGCYCYANSLLRKYIDQLSKSYPYVVIDNEAGMEHLSRRTTEDVDHLLIVSDPSPVGINTAARVRDLVGELGLGVADMRVVINRADGELPGPLLKLIEERGLDIAGVVPSDPAVLELSYAGRSVLELSDGSPAAAAVKELVGRVGL